MEFGMPSLIELDSLGQNVDLCRSLGLSFVELNMNMPWYQLDVLKASDLKAYEDSGVAFTLHLDENLNIWDINPLVSKAYLDTAMRSIELAAHSGMKVLNMHMNHGIYFTLPDRKVWLFERYLDAYMDKTRQFISLCERAIGSSDIKICIENTDGFTSFEREAIGCLLQSPVFRLTLDIGHSHAAGCVDEPFILQNRASLAHIHIHDAIGKSNHLAVGTGQIDIAEKLKLARMQNARCVLETKTVEGLKMSVSNLRAAYL